MLDIISVFTDIKVNIFIIKLQIVSKMNLYCCCKLFVLVFFLISSPLFAGRDSSDLTFSISESSEDLREMSRFEFMAKKAPALSTRELTTISRASMDPNSPAASCYLKLRRLLPIPCQTPQSIAYLTSFLEGNCDFEENGDYSHCLNSLTAIPQKKFLKTLNIIYPYFSQFEKIGSAKLALFLAASNLSLADLKEKDLGLKIALFNFVKDSIRFTPEHILSKALSNEIELLCSLPKEERTESLLLINTTREAFSKCMRPPSDLLRSLLLLKREERTRNFVEGEIARLRREN
jgi:hypothetical protein